MADVGKKRFASHTDEEIVAKRASVFPDNTKKSNEHAARTLRSYLAEKGKSEAFEEFPPERLAEVLGHFYLEARKHDGTLYKSSSLEWFRHSLNRHLKAPPHLKKFDLIKDAEFYEANECFKTAMAELKAAGKGDVEHYPAINEADRKKLYTSIHMSPKTPYGLANKVQFDVRLFFCRPGSENMAKMSKRTFQIRTNAETGLRYVTRVEDELTKNHRSNDRESVSGFMPEDPGSPFSPFFL